MRPIVSPDNKKIAFFSCPMQRAHLNYLDMRLIDTETFEITQVFDVKKKYDPEGFMGICGLYDDLKNFYWLNDNKHLIFTSIQSGQTNIFIVNTETKEVG